MGTKLRILHLIGSGVVGGREKQLAQILRGQAVRADSEVRVLFQKAEGPNYSSIAEIPNVSASVLPGEGELNPRSMLKCGKEIRRSDVVFLHSPRIAFMLPLMLSGKP